MARQKYHSVSIGNLTQAILHKLCTATLSCTEEQDAVLGPVSAVLRSNLHTLTTEFGVRLTRSGKQIGKQALIKEGTRRTKCNREIWKAITSALQSDRKAVRKAGELLQPLWAAVQGDIRTSKTTLFSTLEARYKANPAYAEAASTLSLTQVVDKMFAASEALRMLYKQRSIISATATMPSTSAIKPDLVCAYESFAASVALTLEALPTPELQAIFDQMNDLRRAAAK